MLPKLPQIIVHDISHNPPSVIHRLLIMYQLFINSIPVHQDKLVERRYCSLQACTFNSAAEKLTTTFKAFKTNLKKCSDVLVVWPKNQDHDVTFLRSSLPTKSKHPLWNKIWFQIDHVTACQNY